MNRPWFAHYPANVPQSIDYPKVPVYRLLDDSASRFPTRDAIIYFDGETCQELSRTTYQELSEKSDRFAAGLIGMGVAKGDRVAYYLPNSPELIISFYGIVK